MTTQAIAAVQVDTSGAPPEGHDAAMAAKADAATAAAQASAAPAPAQPAPPAPAERPAWLPEKFASVEALAAAYKELETKQAKPADGKPQTPTAIPAPAEAAQTLETQGFKLDALEAEFSEHGDITEATRAKLAEKGFGKDLVDSYIEGQKSRAEGIRSQVFAAVGGESTYTDMVKWAASNLSADEVKAYNATTSGKDPASIQLAVSGLHARYSAAVGQEPKLVSGATQAAQGGDAFRSVSELTAAMRDPRYAKDPAYRSDVERKLSASSIF
jgi:hypothetical protein